MKSLAESPDQYIAELPEDRKNAVKELRKTLKNGLPSGFEETMQYGMISYVVPLEKFPEGYLGDPKTPLPFISIASQKNFIAFYHMGIYSDKKLLGWFTDAFREATGKKPDMGKSCVRFKKPEDVPFSLIGQLAGKITVKKWIEQYRKNRKR